MVLIEYIFKGKMVVYGFQADICICDCNLEVTKKKRQRIRKHVKSISYINENWILILNYSISNKLAVYVYDKKEGCVVLISFSLNLLTLAKKARIFMPSDLCLYTCKLFRDLVCWMVTLTEVLYLRCFKKSDF